MNSIPAFFDTLLLRSYNVSEFWRQSGNRGNEVVFFVVGIGILVVVLIIYNTLKKK